MDGLSLWHSFIHRLTCPAKREVEVADVAFAGCSAHPAFTFSFIHTHVYSERKYERMRSLDILVYANVMCLMGLYSKIQYYVYICLFMGPLVVYRFKVLNTLKNFAQCSHSHMHHRIAPLTPLHFTHYTTPYQTVPPSL